MPTPYASGKIAKGICDVCGWTYLLRELKPVYNMRADTGVLACPTCWDPDHPQNFLGEVTSRVNDAISLENPRPDFAGVAARSLFGWDPVGNPLTYIAAAVGQVTTNV